MKSPELFLSCAVWALFTPSIYAQVPAAPQRSAPVLRTPVFHEPEREPVNASSAIPVVPAVVTPIHALPFAINAPGYYQVTKNLTGVAGKEGISVNAPYVVIDLNGFTLSGGGGGTTAVQATADCTLINGKVFLWGTGPSLGERARVINVEVTLCADDGLRLSNGVVEDCTIRNNAGNGVFSTTRGTVVRCTIEDNGLYGFLAGADSFAKDSFFHANAQDGVNLGDHSHITRCRADDNAGHGIGVGQGSTVSECASTGNDDIGILCGESSVIQSCFSTANFIGIFASELSLVLDCTVNGNTAKGIEARNQAVSKNCTVTKNPIGISFPGPGARIEGCTIDGSAQDGIVVAGNAFITGNSISSCGGRGIHATSTGNRIEGNALAQNAVGIDVSGTESLIVRNTLDRNTVQMQIGQGNVQGPLLKTKGFISSENPWANFDLSFPVTFP